jgi:hypothetical protein
VVTMQIGEVFNLVSLELSVQRKRYRKHLSQVKAHGTLIYSSLISFHKPHHDGVSGVAPSLCSSRARQAIASPSHFC